MSKHRWSLMLLLGVLLSACSPAQQVAQSPSQAPVSPPATTAAAPTPAPPTQTPVPPTLVPTLVAATEPPATQPPATQTPAATPTLSAATLAPTLAAATTPPVVAQGQEVLTIPAGSGSGQVGISTTDGPPTFRIAADGSIRVMDTLNKRLLFFTGQPFKLTQTLDLSFLQRPTDFVVTGKGDLYVLDAEAWAISHLSIQGAELNNIALNPETKGKFTTISLTADGRIFGLERKNGYLLIDAAGPIPIEDQPNSQVEGSATVRSNAIFSIVADNSNQQRQSLLINYGGVAPATIPLGEVEGEVTFLDINQGMEPYTLVTRGTTAEVQRFSVDGLLLGTLTLDLSGCRAIPRGVYVDRPGDIYTMCVGAQGVSIKHYVMTDAQGQPLPRFDQLVQNAPWSPGSLQSAPG
ncbi:MAG TPA: hypothetical protein VGD69_08420 [Herpetosiphonaceae bacterium]